MIFEEYFAPRREKFHPRSTTHLHASEAELMAKGFCTIVHVVLVIRVHDAASSVDLLEVRTATGSARQD